MKTYTNIADFKRLIKNNEGVLDKTLSGKLYSTYTINGDVYKSSFNHVEEFEELCIKYRRKIRYHPKYN